jgi:hypothetical protein
LRALLARPQQPWTSVWIVPRNQLGQGSTDPANPTPVNVTATTIPVESAHLLADYDDDGQRVTIHLAHAAASDLAEWVRPYDQSFYDGSGPRAAVEGMVAIGAMDVNRIGRYVVDGRTGRIESSGLVVDDRLTWAVALYAGRELPALSAAPGQLTDVYWSTAGFFPELLTQFVHGLYANYEHRLTPLTEIAELAAQGGRPSSLVRVDTRQMVIADAYAAPAGAIIASPQFVPKPGSSAATDGWLVSTVFTPERLELWVFDAQSLSGGPLARVDASALGMGFSLHTAWLPEVAPRTAGYHVNVVADAGERAKHEQVRELVGAVADRLASRG